ncbi:NAD-dependent epimerase/dehydratase family protein (plasmid) [Bernardetia sp. Wsw4-3y2]|uniref:NAD-dependent epimerase/dehydratase family protein n=1 Tax=Bernardetia sp. Wsw4-3y2 TaxID=3127471 RepID=UPI0030D35504
MSKKKILIIGYGFVGQNIYKKLDKNLFDVTVLSPHTEDKPEIGFVRAKLQDLTSIKDLDLENTIIIHTAHVGYPLHDQDTLYREVEENLNPFLLLLDFIKNSKGCRVVYISSGGAIYGKPQKLPVMESHVLQPISFYGLCKKYMEEALHLYSMQYGLEYDIVRPSNIYDFNWKTGKKQGLISALVKSIEEKTLFYLWGDGSAKKDYIHVDCFSEAITKIVDTKASNTVFNVSANKSYSTKDIINLVEKKYGQKINIIQKEVKNQDISEIRLDNTKIKNHIKWNPRIDIF